MIIKVCIGSSCHLKGSREVVEKFQQLIEKHQLDKEINLIGKFCMGECQKGVNVEINKKIISVDPQNLESVFEEYVLNQLRPL